MRRQLTTTSAGGYVHSDIVRLPTPYISEHCWAGVCHSYQLSSTTSYQMPHTVLTLAPHQVPRKMSALFGEDVQGATAYCSLPNRLFDKTKASSPVKPWSVREHAPPPPERSNTCAAQVGQWDEYRNMAVPASHHCCTLFIASSYDGGHIQLLILPMRGHPFFFSAYE